MNYKRYYKTDELKGDGNIRFRRYSSTPLEPIEDNSRFLKFVEGTLEALVADDFDGATEITAFALFSTITSGEDALRKIELPDSVLSIGEQAFCNNDVTEIIFGKNISKINSGSCVYSNENESKCIADFSRVSSIPTRIVESSSASNPFTECTVIRVPTSLYYTWKNKTDWSDLADKIVGV